MWSPCSLGPGRSADAKPGSSIGRNAGMVEPLLLGLSCWRMAESLAARWKTLASDAGISLSGCQCVGPLAALTAPVPNSVHSSRVATIDFEAGADLHQLVPYRQARPQRQLT